MTAFNPLTRGIYLEMRKEMKWTYYTVKYLLLKDSGKSSADSLGTVYSSIEEAYKKLAVQKMMLKSLTSLCESWSTQWVLVRIEDKICKGSPAPP